MAVAYRSSSNTGNDQNVSALSPAVPAGAAAGDVVIAVLSRWGGSGAVTPPSGFTDWGTAYLSGDSAANIRIYWKRLTAGDTGTYAFTWTGATWSHMHVLCFSGVIASGTPIEDVDAWSGTAGTYGSVSNTTATIPGLVWTTYNDSSGTHTPPTGFTEVIDQDCGTAAYQIASASGTQTASGGSVTSSSPSAAVLVALMPAAGGGSSAPANTATETDTAQSFGKRKTRTVATAAESDTSRPIGRSKVRGTTLAAETDTALPFTRSKRKSASQALSAETALPIGRLRSRPLGTAAGTEQALPIGKRKSKAAGQAAEADTAIAIGSTSGTSQPMGTAVETETALPIGHRRSRAIGTALEFDTAGEASFLSPAWRLIPPSRVDEYQIRGWLSTTLRREVTVFGDEAGLTVTELGTDAIPFGTKYIWLGGHVNTTDDPAVKNLWLSHGFEVENVQL